jgi:hypothetical protein
MKHIWTVLCQKSSIDNETNLLSLFNCVEELSLIIDKTKAPRGNLVIPIEFQLVSFWTVENSNKDNTLEMKGELIDSNGKILNKFENKFNIKKGISRFRNRTNFQGLPITEAGRYIIKMMQKNEDKKEFEIVTELPLDIKISYKLMDIPDKKV